jgi:uncharacterized surface protein with fasciclin (FAS1) repeats
MNKRFALKAIIAAAALATVSACAGTGSNDLVDVAAANGIFTTLVAPVQAAGLLEDTLLSDGPFTVFAQTDATFATLPAGTVESLFLPENKDALVGILTYPVLPGSVKAANVLGAKTNVATVDSKELTVDVTRAGVPVNNTRVVIANVHASDGMTHVIDKVLLQ